LDVTMIASSAGRQWIGMEPEPQRDNYSTGPGALDYDWQRYEADHDAWDLARCVRTMRERYAKFDKAAVSAAAAVEAEESAWQALSTAPTAEWVAAHHRWVLAADRARRLVQEYDEREHGLEDDFPVSTLEAMDRLPDGPRTTQMEAAKKVPVSRYMYENELDKRGELAATTLRNLPV
jgi:predicted DNA-binding protein (UPF0251 family)